MTGIALVSYAEDQNGFWPIISGADQGAWIRTGSPFRRVRQPVDPILPHDVEDAAGEALERGSPHPPLHFGVRFGMPRHAREARPRGAQERLPEARSLRLVPAEGLVEIDLGARSDRQRERLALTPGSDAVPEFLHELQPLAGGAEGSDVCRALPFAWGLREKAFVAQVSLAPQGG